MPTTRPRHSVTETDELVAASDAATKRWPGQSRAQLIVKLALEGSAGTAASDTEQRARRLAVLHRNAGLLTGLYPAGYRERLRNEWSE